MPTDRFNFYANVIALSFENPKGKAEVMKSDFLMRGDAKFLTNSIIEMMERHPEFAAIITNAAYNYLVRNGKPGEKKVNGKKK
jgi:hypothetical protein